MGVEKWWFLAGCAVEIIAVGVGLTLSPTWGWSIAVVGLLLLAFAVWRIRRTSASKEQASNAKEKVLTELASFIPEGEHIRRQCYDQKMPVPEKEAKAWAEKVAIFLDSVGKHYRPIFNNSDGLGTAKIPPMYSPEHQRVALFISYRLMRIQQFLAELRGLKGLG